MIKFIDFQRRYILHKKEINEAVQNVFRRGLFILGPEVEKFEKKFADFLGSKHVIAVNSGTDAIFLALKALDIGEGDEVITVANTAVPTISAIRMTGASPVFVDIDEQTFNIDVSLIEKKITKKTRAILPVHLYGNSADMSPIMKIAREYDLKVIEDAAQAHGARYKGKFVGTIGDIGCFSFYPTKNLGAFGDGGAIVINNEKIENELRALRNYGETAKNQNEFEGVNSRLDELQAAILNWGLGKLEYWNHQREKIAKLYLTSLKSTPISLPIASDKNSERVWHLFVIKSEQRDELKEYLAKKEIQTMIHYPKPIYKQSAYGFLEYSDDDLPETSKATKMILTLPLYPELKEKEVIQICHNIKLFYANRK